MQSIEDDLHKRAIRYKRCNFIFLYKQTQRTETALGWVVGWYIFNDNPANTKHCIIFVQRRPNVFDVGPTLYKCYTNVSCLLGRVHARMRWRCMGLICKNGVMFQLNLYWGTIECLPVREDKQTACVDAEPCQTVTSDTNVSRLNASLPNLSRANYWLFNYFSRVDQARYCTIWSKASQWSISWSLTIKSRICLNVKIIIMMVKSSHC